MVTEAEVMEALPPRGFLRCYVLYAKEVTDSHAAYHLGAGLCLLSQMVPIGGVEKPGVGYFPWASEMWGNIFTLLVGISSDSRKTEAIKLMRRVIVLAGMKDRIGREPGSEEVLIDNVAANPRQVLCFHEFGNFLASTQHSYKTPLKTRLNDLADGIPQARETVKGKREGKPIVCDTPRVSVVGGVTPDYLEYHTEPTDWTGGFLARFVMFHAKRERLIEIPNVDAAAWARDQVVERFKELATDPDGVVSGVGLGPCRGFDEGATAVWLNWVRTIDKKELPNEIKSAYSRAQPHAVRIAFLIAADIVAPRLPAPNAGAEWWVTAAALIPAIKIAELHVKSIASIWAKLASSPYARSRRMVLEALEPAPAETRFGDVLIRTKLDIKTARNALDGLIEEGFVRKMNSHDGSEFFGRRDPPQSASAQILPFPAPGAGVGASPTSGGTTSSSQSNGTSTDSSSAPAAGSDAPIDPFALPDAGGGNVIKLF